MQRKRIRTLAIAAGVVLLALLAAGQYVSVVVEEFYSPGMQSSSAEHAWERGVLLARVAVGDSVLRWGGREYRVREAWIEDRQQVRYRAFLFRRDSLLNRPALAVRIVAHGHEEGLCGALERAVLVANGSTVLDATNCSRWSGAVRRPFPAGISIGIREPDAGGATRR